MSVPPQELVQQKTLELCQAIAQLPGFGETHRKMQAFLEDELVKFEFQMVNNRVRLLTEKQAAGLEVTPEEIRDLEAFRDEVLGKEVARNFIAAQAEFEAIQKLVYPMLSKTFEVGRVPVPEDFYGENCDSSCGLH
ncbi:MAG: YlbF family regulator [Verrucomicrobia bacterium]|nr:YlbF family regulator [Verrucomicrobiota bacterium]